jgi:PAS domain S-box-containing protein
MNANVILPSLSLVAAACAVVVICAVARITVSRKMSHAWINILFSLASASVGWELFQHAWAANHVWPAAIQAATAGLAISMIACAASILPMQRRISSNKGYDELWRANKLLEYHTRIFDRFLDELPAMTYILDESGQILHVNKRFAGFFKLKISDILGKSTFQILGTESAVAFIENNRLVFSSGGQHEFLEDLIFNDSPTQWLSIKFLIVDQDAKKMLCGISLDLTEILKLKGIDNVLASIVELMPDATYTIDSNGLITSWNPGSEHLFGYTEAEIIGKHISVLAPADLQSEPIITKPELKESVIGHETVRVAKDRTMLDVSISASKIPGFKKRDIFYSQITRDIRRMKQAEQELRALNQELQARFLEVSQTNEALQTARDQALEVSALKSAFVSTVSHELRTPLSGILGLSELLLLKPLDGSTIEEVQTISASAQALLTIVDDILDLSKLEAGTLALVTQPFDPEQLVNDCIKLMRSEAANKNLRIELSRDSVLPMCVYGDGGRLRQVLLNLLSNAVKFTDGGTVTVSTAVEREDGETVHIKFTIADTGRGIASSDAKLLFSPFFRVSACKTIAGTGLGLAICKNLVELMGGEISFSSSLGQGSTFWFSVPFKKKLSIQTPLVPIVSLGQARCIELLTMHKVLVVEDNPILADLVTRQLAHIGIEAQSAATGGDAIIKALTGDFDIILLDIHLPDMSGYEVTKFIRQQEELESQRPKVIIALTAGAMAGDRKKALESGMDDYLAKPVAVAQLREMLLCWLIKVEALNGHGHASVSYAGESTS